MIATTVKGMGNLSELKTMQQACILFLDIYLKEVFPLVTALLRVRKLAYKETREIVQVHIYIIKYQRTGITEQEILQALDSLQTLWGCNNLIGYITDLNANDFRRLSTSVKKNLKTIDGYTPKNNKCFCYPYNYMILTNNSGLQSVLKYELFNNPNSAEVTINYYPVVSTSPVLFCVPFNYRGQNYDYENAVQFANFPLLPWKYDVFSNWAAVHSNSLTMSFIQKGLSIATSAISGNASGVLSGAMSTANELADLADRQQQPDVVKGIPQGNALLYSGGAGVFARCIGCKAEYISIIDDYFTRYGYLVHEVKKPLLKNRVNFDYIQTQNVEIVGGVPSDDLEELCSIFDNGVTIWHNPTTFGDYEVNNKPV